ncbi:phage tail protein, partial [Aliarcobacter cryaerophilus]|uniref:phage tail protein n=1 Tax=Aliarcobacter cryaerophilus TaxID=28198 RepID=UPI0021B601BF
MENFYTLLANTGINAIISARASNSEVKLTKIAVGDGDIIPSQDMTALKSEKHRFNINSIIQDIDNPNYLIIEGVIPSNVGGFYVSEVAIYTDQNILFAIGSLPKTYKPLLEEGSAKDLTIKIFLEITNADSVTLKVDDSVVLATRKFVLSELKKYALINGDETKKFKVADAVELNEAINKKQFDDNAVKLSGNQTIAGVKTFSFNPITTASQGAGINALTRKDYVDGLDSANVKLTGNQTIAGVKTFSFNPITTASQGAGINALTRKDYVDGLDSANV